MTLLSKPWQKYLAVLMVGVLAGALGLRLVESLTMDQALEQQEAELTRLEAQRQQREEALAESQTLLKDEAARIRNQAARTAELMDQVLQSQGSATERLKKIIATVKALKETLKSNVP